MNEAEISTVAGNVFKLYMSKLFFFFFFFWWTLFILFYFDEHKISKASILFFFVVKIELYWYIIAYFTVRDYSLNFGKTKNKKSNGLFWVLGFYLDVRIMRFFSWWLEFNFSFWIFFKWLFLDKFDFKKMKKYQEKMRLNICVDYTWIGIFFFFFFMVLV